MRTPSPLFALAFALASLPATGQQHAGHHAEMHASPHEPGGSPLREPGESISAALGEVVALLESDPATDWSRVDLTALARHLQQMNRLFSGASVETVNVPGGARFRVRGDDAVLEAARAMVPAHAAISRSETGWRAEVEERESELVVTVVGDEAEEAKIRALGFLGWMASGDHHRAHHLMMARGERH